MAWQQIAAPVIFWVCFTLGRRLLGRFLLRLRREKEVVEEGAAASSAAAEGAADQASDAPEPKAAPEAAAPKAAKRTKKHAKGGGAKACAAPRDDRALGPQRSHNPLGGLAVCGVMVAVAAGASSYVHRTYGPEFFVSPDKKTLGLSGAAWRDLLEDRSVAFVGGQHRSGTTVLWRCLAAHGDVAWFGEQRESGLDFSEGAFAQNVYPRFGVGAEFLTAALRYVKQLVGEKSRPTAEDGVGRYALAPAADVYWTEDHEAVNGDAQADVLNAFGYHWDKRPPFVGGAKVLLEKSPPNVVLARYLQALVDYVPGAANRAANARAAPGETTTTTTPKKKKAAPKTCENDACEFGFDGGGAQRPERSRARFVFVTRHPLATAVSHKKLGGVSSLSTYDLVAHWIAVQEYAAANAPRLAHVKELTLEAFAADPAATLLDLWRFLGLDANATLANDAVAHVKPDPNANHRADYCASLATDATARREHARIVDHFAGLVKTHAGHYDLAAWCEA